MYEGDGHAALADGGGDALHRPKPDVAARKDAGDARLQQVGIAVERPAPRAARVGAREYVAALVERDLRREPCRLRIRADEDNSPPDSRRVVAPVAESRTSIAWSERSPCTAATSAPKIVRRFGRVASWSIR